MEKFKDIVFAQDSMFGMLLLPQVTLFSMGFIKQILERIGGAEPTFKLGDMTR